MGEVKADSAIVHDNSDAAQRDATEALSREIHNTGSPNLDITRSASLKIDDSNQKSPHIDLLDAATKVIKDPAIDSLIGSVASMGSERIQARLFGTTPLTYDEGWLKVRVLDNRVQFGTAALVGGISTYSLYSDLSHLSLDNSPKSNIYYGIASGFDAAAIAGSAMSFSPVLRKYSMPLMGIASYGRFLMGL